MKRNPNSALRNALAALALTSATTLAWSQVSIYQYSESVQPYTEVTAAEASYSLGNPTYDPPYHNLRAWVNNAFFGVDGQITNGGYLSGASGPGYPIGFNFQYNGDVFDVIGVSDGGWISFGKSSDGATAVWCYTADHPHGMPFVQYIGGPDVPYKRNRIAGFGSSNLRMQNMSPLVPPGPVSSLRLATLGTAPNRVFVVQFKDFRASYSPSTTLINFQIRLNEADNSVEVRYGQMVFGYESGGGAQVGLGGQVPEDFNSRMTVSEQPAFLYDWNATVPGVLNTDYCNATQELFSHPNGSGIPPVPGRNFKWTPAACAPPVWPLAMSDISFDAAHAAWPANAAGNYEYFVSTENSVTGPEVTSGTTTDPFADLFGLEASTTYYVFVRSICGGEPGEWSLATQFQTMGGGVVVCDGTVMTENYCADQYSTKEWRYVSADGSKLRIEFTGGVVSTGANAYFKVWDNADGSGQPIYSSTGIVAGQAFESVNGTFYMRLLTDAGACQAQDWFYPLQWRVGCKNCNDPLINFAVGTVDCPNQQYFVAANVFNIGSSSSLVIGNNLGVAPTTITSTGLHAVGPFPAGEPVLLTAQNPDNPMCHAEAPSLVNDPCVIQDCGPTWYERCAAAHEVRDWLLQGNNQPISVRFPPGYFGWDAKVRVYDGPDELSPATLVSDFGNTNNQVVTSTNAENKLLVRYEATTYNDYACTLGNTLPLKFVAQCAQACVQPAATFDTECLSPTQYNVVVNLTNTGSTGSTTITNDGGAPTVTANAAGTYTVGPFASAAVVHVNLEGANVVCTWNSTGITKDCTGMGVASTDAAPLRVFPNPSNGSFQVELPNGMAGRTDLQVMDLTGRVVHVQAIAARTATMDLGHLPNGLYTLVARNGSLQTTSKISIQH